MDQTRRRNHHKRRVYRKLINENPELALDIEESVKQKSIKTYKKDKLKISLNNLEKIE